ncbi:hypothetical protein Mapa_014694 [Marchantia paleacea]|nr:hypothetical protein Mapa_014694 [Marchantia paleacea]
MGISNPIDETGSSMNSWLLNLGEIGDNAFKDLEIGMIFIGSQTKRPELGGSAVWNTLVYDVLGTHTVFRSGRYNTGD